jgi:hypothetical protein
MHFVHFVRCQPLRMFMWTKRKVGSCRSTAMRLPREHVWSGEQRHRHAFAGPPRGFDIVRNCAETGRVLTASSSAACCASRKANAKRLELQKALNRVSSDLMIGDP